MTLEDRVSQLEAQNLALLYALASFTPLIPFPADTMLSAHTAALDALNAHMAQAGDDATNQRAVRMAFESAWAFLAPGGNRTDIAR